MLQARADHTAVRRSERVQTGLDKFISGLNPKLDCGPVQGQMPNHGLDQGPVQKGSGSNRGSGLNCGKPISGTSVGRVAAACALLSTVAGRDG